MTVEVKFESLENIANAPLAELSEVNGVGEVIGIAVKEWFSEEWHKEIVVLLREQRGHRFAVRDAPDGLGEQEGHRQLADLAAGLGRVGQRDGVGDDDLIQLRAGDALDGRA